MTMISSAGTQPAISLPSGGGLVRWIGRGAFALAAFLERRSAIRALRERDDRELRDIGIVRSQIEAAVGGAFHPDMGRKR